MEYKTVRQKTTLLLDVEINKSFLEGWKLFGTPFYADPYYVQSMTRGTDKPATHIYRIDLKDCKNFKEATTIQDAFLNDRVKIFDGNNKILFKFNKD
jgi:hypothetical protein